MIILNVPIEDLIKQYHFKKCKGHYGKSGLYYLCVSRGCDVIFLSEVYLGIQKWEDRDPRIHTRPNCRYSDQRRAIEILIDMANKQKIGLL